MMIIVHETSWSERLKSPFLEMLEAQLDKALSKLSDLKIRANFKFGAALGWGLDQMMR